MRVLRPAKEIADGARVTYRTGDDYFVLNREMRVYRNGEVQTTIKADQGYVFLVSPCGNHEEISDGMRLLQEVDNEPAA